MTRDDHIRATVAYGMRDCYAIREALSDSIRAAFREGNESAILIDIASMISEAAILDDWDSVSPRLAYVLECHARAALTAKAEDNTPQPDDEENDDV